MNKKKKLGWLSAIGGTAASTLGILGVTCIVCTPICGALCVSGILATLAGVGIATFLYKYHLIFIAIGITFLILGITLLLKSKKKWTCSNESN